MDRMLKVFCSGADQDRFAETYAVIERYQGFVLAQVPEQAVSEIGARYPVEDITDLYILQVGERIIDTSRPRIDAKGKVLDHPAYEAEKRLSKGPHHHLVQFIGPIKEAWLAEVKKLGGDPKAPHGAFSYVVRSDEKALAKIGRLAFVRWVGHLPHGDRIAASALEMAGRKADNVAAELPRTRVLPGAYTVEFFDAANMKAALLEIKALGFEVLEKDKAGRVAVISDPRSGAGTAKRLRALSTVHGVRFIRERSFKRPTNDVAARIMGTAVATGQAGLGLSGAGEVIAVCDTGIDTADPQSIHPDFSGRVVAIESYPITPDLSRYVNNPGGDDGAADLDSGHGTHVAGSALGDGSASEGLDGLSGPVRGLAHKAKLVFQAVEQEMQWKDPANYQRYGRYLLTGIPLDLATLFGNAYHQNARIHSNSWGGGDPGAYDSQCEQLDRFVWEHKDFCVVVAAGNDGTDHDGDGSINPMSVSSPATAKNCICVGASENERPGFNGNTYGRWWADDYPVAPYNDDPMANNPEQVVAFSSRGPTRDGRIKPDVVAPGTFVLSARSRMLAPNNMAWSGFPSSRLYFYMGGTSMATPLTSGAVALIREYLRKERQISTPSAALLKAALIAGAVRLPGYGAQGAVADNDQGYGRVNVDAVLAPAAPTQVEFLDIAPGLRTGEVYSQPIQVQGAGAPLRVTLAYSDYPGPALVNNLNLMLIAPDGKRYVGNQAQGTLLTMDARNNVEVIHIQNPAAGTWRLEVVGSNVPQGPQDFGLVYMGELGEGETGERVRGEAAPELEIPDNTAQGVSSTISLDQAGVIGSIKVGVDIGHTYIGDLRVVLAAPDGTAVVLHDRSGASADDIIQTYDVHNIPGLAAFSGAALQGDWTLTVSDHARRDVGTLRRWSLEIALAAGATLNKEASPFLAIPDNDPAGVSAGIDVAEGGALKAISVWLDITHTWVGDLKVALSAPSGTTVTLHDRSGGSQDNLIRTYDVAGLAALQAFNGEEVQGRWTLSVADLAGRDVGKLNRWGFEILI